MRVHYRELLGRRVVAADGRDLGRVADLVAEPWGEALRVTALLVGPGAIARRIGFRRSALLRVAPPRRIPWELVDRLDGRISLRVGCDELAVVDECEALPVVHDGQAAGDGG